MIGLSRTEQRVFWRCIIYGALVTIIVVALEQGGKLEDQVENRLYDARAQLFQARSAIRESKIVHVQIDDASIREIGRWPWRRTVLADVIDEISQAGAKAIGLDIILDERSTDDDDARLAEAVNRSGRVLLPLDIKFGRLDEQTPLRDAMRKALAQDPEQSLDALVSTVAGEMKRKVEAVRAWVEGEHLDELRLAFIARMEAVFPGDLPDLSLVEQKLTPRAVEQGMRTIPRKELGKAYAQLSAFRAASRYVVPTPDTPLLKGDSGTITETSLMLPAACTGFVNFLPAVDGTVRQLPLLAELRGRTFAHMSLALACMEIGVSTSDLRVQGEWLVAKGRDGRGFSIPIRTREAPPDFGRVGSIADIPWQGRRGNQWTTMYDVPAYDAAKNYISLSDVHAIQGFENSIAANEEEIHKAIGQIIERVYAPREPNRPNERLIQFERDWPTLSRETRRERAESTLADPRLAFNLRSADETNPEKNVLKVRELLAARSALRNLPAANRNLNDLIARQRESLKVEMKDRIVMIGWSAVASTDFFPTSLHAQCPGVVIQGAMTNAILADTMKRRTGRSVWFVLTAMTGAFATLLGARFRPNVALAVILPLLFGYFFVNGFYFYDRLRIGLPLAGVTVAGASVWIVLTLVRFLFERREKLRVTRRFSSNVDPRIVNYYIEHPELAGKDAERKELSVVFTDLQGFSALSEKLKEGVVPVINAYMGRMLPVIRANEGTWDKFIGDGIMFFFNAPEPVDRHPAKAVRTVLQMQAETAKLSVELQSQGLPAVAMRAGVTTGMMIVGDAGSLNKDFHASNYTVLGDLVNLSSRLEAANKFFDTRTLVLRSTKDAAEEFLYRPIAKIRVYGKNESAEVFEPLALRESASDVQKKLAEMTERAVAEYRRNELDSSLETITRIEQEFGENAMWRLYREHIRRIKAGEEPFDEAFTLGGK